MHWTWDDEDDGVYWDWDGYEWVKYIWVEDGGCEDGGYWVDEDEYWTWMENN